MENSYYDAHKSIKIQKNKTSVWVPGVIQFNPKSIFYSKEQFILNACHAFCGSENSNALSKQIFEQYPYANVYKDIPPSHIFTLGSIEIKGETTIPKEGSSSSYQRGVINMFTQRYCGSSRERNDYFQLRFRAFISCLNKVYRIKNLQSIAMQQKFASGQGEQWINYLAILQKYVQKYPQIQTIIYTGMYLKNRRNFMNFSGFRQ